MRWPGRPRPLCRRRCRVRAQHRLRCGAPLAAAACGDHGIRLRSAAWLPLLVSAACCPCLALAPAARAPLVLAKQPHFQLQICKLQRCMLFQVLMLSCLPGPWPAAAPLALAEKYKCGDPTSQQCIEYTRWGNDILVRTPLAV